jgi:uncharacterized phage protein gp47/JayE
MAVQIPTISDLYTSILSKLESELDVQIPFFTKNFLRAMAAVQAAKLKLFYLSIASVQKNVFVDTAEPEVVGGTLERFGRVKLGRNPFVATAGEYEVSVTGTIGATIPANTTFKSNDDSANPDKLFVLDVAYVLISETDSITLRALESGLNSRLSVGDALTSTSPIANIDSTAVVNAETITPLASELLEDYRQKAIEAYRLEPQGGAGADYRLWSYDAQGVQQVYPYAKSGAPNEIDVFVEATEVDSVDGKGTPTGAILTEVEEVIEFNPDVTKPLNERGRRPLGVSAVNVQAVTIKDIDVTITGYQNLTAGKQTEIENAIKAYLSTVRPFVASIDVLTNRNDSMTVFNLIFEVQNAVKNSVFTSLTFEVDSVEVPSFQFTQGDIPYLNSITYV